MVSRRTALTAGLALAGLPLLTGCDRAATATRRDVSKHTAGLLPTIRSRRDEHAMLMVPWG